MQREITILQISDIHRRKITNSPVESREQPFKKLFLKAKGTLQELAQNKTDFIVFNGDIVNNGQTNDLHEAYTQFIDPILDMFSGAQLILVPGNHDVDREKWVKNASLEDFQAIADKGINPWTNDGINQSDSIFLWVVNSVPLSGARDPLLEEHYQQLDIDITQNLNDNNLKQLCMDPAYVTGDSMDACKRRLKDDTSPIRIAILHHNPLPFPRENSENLKRYRFINDGDFNKFLDDQDFNIVLHGHQHASRVSYLSTTDLKAGSGTSNHFKGGIVFIGAPAFGGSIEFGFNYIKITHNPDKNGNPGSIKALIKTFFFDSTNSTSEVAYTLPARKFSEENSKVANKVIEHIAQNKDLYKIKNAVGYNRTENQHWDNVNNIKRNLINIRAIYSLAVFPPKVWNSKRLTEFFLPEGIANMMNAVTLANSVPNIETDLASPSLLFRFTRPVFYAIKNALEISKGFDVAGKIRSRYDEVLGSPTNPVQKELRRFLNKLTFNNSLDLQDVGHSLSLSVWDNATSGNGKSGNNVKTKGAYPNPLSGTNIHFELNDYELSNSLKEDLSKARVHEVMEFPRILIWEISDFLQPEAAQCITFHEECGFPLFWLRPSSLQYNGNLRQKYGHMTVYSTHRSDAGSITVEEASRPKDLYNDIKGDNEISNNSELMLQIWNEDARPPGLLGDSTALDEYKILLGRKDLIFAVDAWAMIVMGFKDELKTHLDNLDYWPDPPEDN